ncbi:hypothetical protein [Desulforamulus ruminis]|uniref:Uncharacterized protein n=1 Tax=Desulforamulus ruminis (strain ATCC 23193 / DSM 2154 / NCIMB 8452 / DL) TaxID=696281 RepID=F6DPM2_DESRL|nr:hypothetical protein [Desulforamulus ruminis]AEG59599.1 hypothetical protein Desru_1325 [Desulforamulus ruminis DSM 2154]
MIDKTANYNLRKPGQEDFYNVEDFNANADIIDVQLKALNDKTEAQAGSIMAHTAAEMPHIMTDGSVRYQYGFKPVTVNGSKTIAIVYEVI